MLRDFVLFRLLLATFAGWVNQNLQGQVDYLLEENRVLKEQLRGRRLRLTDDQRRRLAAKGKALGRRLLAKLTTIVSPETILAWHRQLIAAKWTFPKKRPPGRPPLANRLRELILRMVKENPSWGYARIQGALRVLGHVVARSTIARILKINGLPPAPERPATWRTFLDSHANVMAAADFFTGEVWTARGLVTHYVLFLIDHGTRAIHVAGITPNPDDRFMAQVARNLTDCFDGILSGTRYLIVDRDSKFSAQFRRTVTKAGIEVIRTCFNAPNMNAFAERFVRSIKSECLSKMIFFGEPSLRRAVTEFVAHYHAERPHQGIGNVLIQPEGGLALTDAGPVRRKKRLGGLLSYYHRSAA